MARPIRIEYNGAFNHVTARGNERKRIFFNRIDYQKFKEYIKEVQEKFTNDVNRRKGRSGHLLQERYGHQKTH